MYPAPFDYRRPATLSEAVALLAQHGEDAKILAGGHSLIPAMKLRLARPSVVVDIGRIPELNYIREHAGRVTIGATTTHHTVEMSETTRKLCPLVPEVAAHIGDVQVRNKGTIGGSLVHADPAGDWPAAVLALDAELVIAGPKGLRTVRAVEFFVGLMTSAVSSGEVLCEVRLPLTGRSVAYVKTEQQASGFALCGVAAVVDAERGQVSIGITGVGAVPYRAAGVERALNGRALTAASIEEAAGHAADGVDPLSDIHASAEFRAHLAQLNTKRALMAALAKR
jgi:carbon-monoxide dehydrogenase medium subunit